jgi:pyrroline-5-carboxylate reductase
MYSSFLKRLVWGVPNFKDTSIVVSISSAGQTYPSLTRLTSTDEVVRTMSAANLSWHTSTMPRDPGRSTKTHHQHRVEKQNDSKHFVF